MANKYQYSTIVWERGKNMKIDLDIEQVSNYINDNLIGKATEESRQSYFSIYSQRENKI